MLPKVILRGYVVVPREDLEAIKRELPIHIENTRKEEGCLIFDVIQENEHSTRFNVHEEFIDKESFQVHQERVRNSNWGKISRNIERHYHIEQNN